MLQYRSRLQLVKVCHQTLPEAQHPPLVQLCNGTIALTPNPTREKSRKADSSLRASKMPDTPEMGDPDYCTPESTS